MEALGRAGLVARGVLYLVIAVLAIQLARGRREETADKAGALDTVAEQPFGRVLMVLLAAGFLAYAIWRLTEAIVGSGLGGGGDDAKATVKRLSKVAKAALYGSLFVSTLPFIFGDAAREGSEDDGGGQERGWTGKVLEWPLGRFLVGGTGAAFIGGGFYLGYRGLTQKFDKHLDTGRMSSGTERVVRILGVVGHVGRMIVFGLIGVFLIRAAVEYDPDEAVGIDGALQEVVQANYGPVLLGLVAASLFAFGLYSLCEARWRRVLEG